MDILTSYSASVWSSAFGAVAGFVHRCRPGSRASPVNRPFSRTSHQAHPSHLRNPPPYTKTAPRHPPPSRINVAGRSAAYSCLNQAKPGAQEPERRPAVPWTAIAGPAAPGARTACQGTAHAGRSPALGDRQGRPRPAADRAGEVWEWSAHTPEALPARTKLFDRAWRPARRSDMIEALTALIEPEQNSRRSPSASSSSRVMARRPQPRIRQILGTVARHSCSSPQNGAGEAEIAPARAGLTRPPPTAPLDACRRCAAAHTRRLSRPTSKAREAFPPARLCPNARIQIREVRRGQRAVSAHPDPRAIPGASDPR